MNLIHVPPIVFLHRHDDPIASSHIMQKEIPERIKGLLRESVRDREHASVDLRSGRRRGQRSYVAGGTSNLVEKFRAFLGQGSLRELLVSRGSFWRSHKASETFHICQPVRT